ncbi:restriction endonuclease subunit S [Vibrio campbellii]|uniref:restriction endonuclease subunit S n=1 Tax=Vibrio campbellii TaxID=680 RepID=UPI003857DA47
MKPYPRYNQSSARWYSSFPENWSEVKAKRLFSNERERASSEDEQLAASQKYGVIPQALMMTQNNAKVTLALKGTDNFKQVKENDFVISLRSFEGGIEHSKYNGCISPAYTVLRLQHESSYPNYFRYALKCSPFIQALNSTSEGIRDGKTITYDEFGELLVVLPSQAEQKTIATFLDRETQRIDSLIEEKQTFIKLLKEKRQALISHVVTKGLNPDVQMQDSGIEWIGQVPKHWSTLQLGKVTLSKCDGPFGSGLKSSHYTDSGVRVIRLQNIKSGYFAQGKDAYIDKEYYANNLRNHDVLEGDLLLAGLGDPKNPVGRACVAPPGIEPAMVKADCFRFRLDSHKVTAEFVAYQLTAGANYDSGILSTGATRSRIPLMTMATRKIAICPIEEQKAIVVVLEKKLDKLERLIKETSTSINLLHERRTSLISAAVTGKIDVREAV